MSFYDFVVSIRRSIHPIAITCLFLAAILVLCEIAFATLTRRVRAATAAITTTTTTTTTDDDDDAMAPPPSKRSRRHAFERGVRVPNWTRSSEIVLPDWSDDTRECDDFRRARECSLSEGYRACFECIESRDSLRICAHVAEAVTIRIPSAAAVATVATTVATTTMDADTVILPPNSASDKGYCVSEALAAQLRELTDRKGNGSTARARRECKATNADWILVRRQRTSANSSFNFACRCKYPHLMTNAHGPMSACSRAVGCNGHGRLDEDSRSSSVDPFVNGRCECERGWLSEYDGESGVGPYCREATVAEWPSLILKRPRLWPSDRDNEYLDLFSDYIDAKFRAVLTRQRRDDEEDDGRRHPRRLYLKNPCHPCPIATTDDNGANFCGDEISVRSTDGKLFIAEARIGVLGERDYLRGNGGQFPNACLVVSEAHLNNGRFLMQFLTTRDVDGGLFAPEIGLLVNVSTLEQCLFTKGGFSASERYRAFERSLVPPKTSIAKDGGVVRGTIWLANNAATSQHRRRVVESLQWWYSGSGGIVSDLAYRSTSTLLFPFAYYYDALVMNVYHYLPAMHYDEDNDMIKKYRVQRTRTCPDARGLDSESIVGGSVETNKEIAHELARAMVPVCDVKDRTSTGKEYIRPRVNCAHPNDTGCVVIESGSFINYGYAFWYPTKMNMRRFCNEQLRSSSEDIE